MLIRPVPQNWSYIHGIQCENLFLAAVTATLYEECSLGVEYIYERKVYRCKINHQYTVAGMQKDI